MKTHKDYIDQNLFKTDPSEAFINAFANYNKEQKFADFYPQILRLGKEAEDCELRLLERRVVHGKIVVEVTVEQRYVENVTVCKKTIGIDTLWSGTQRVWFNK